MDCWLTALLHASRHRAADGRRVPLRVRLLRIPLRLPRLTPEHELQL